MSKLITLKDIEVLAIDGAGCCCHDSIRKEAIKWIKTKFPTKIGFERDSYYWGGRSELMKFFNITEEDLE